MRLGITMDTKSIHVGVLPDGRKAIQRSITQTRFFYFAHLEELVTLFKHILVVVRL